MITLEQLQQKITTETLENFGSIFPLAIDIFQQFRPVDTHALLALMADQLSLQTQIATGDTSSETLELLQTVNHTLSQQSANFDIRPQESSVVMTGTITHPTDQLTQYALQQTHTFFANRQTGSAYCTENRLIAKVGAPNSLTFTDHHPLLANQSAELEIDPTAPSLCTAIAIIGLAGKYSYQYPNDHTIVGPHSDQHVLTLEQNQAFLQTLFQ